MDCQQNRYLESFIKSYVEAFRMVNSDVFFVSLFGLDRFIDKDNPIIRSLFRELENHGFTVASKDAVDSVSSVHVGFENTTKGIGGCFDIQLSDISSEIELSRKTDIPLSGLLVMKTISRIICENKTLFKAFALDLDETLWPGTLSEDGKERIITNLRSAQGQPFISFMKYVRALANNLGIFVAICSRNDASEVERTIAELDEAIFPLKDQIDCIIANNNDKSGNLKAIAEQLSILPSAIVFIDDNHIVRDEVKNSIPGMFVPDWERHDDLITLLNASCVFDRFELSINSQNRRKQRKIIQAEREQNALPNLKIKVCEDSGNVEAHRLYVKSNQFKFWGDNNVPDSAQSLYFEILRENGQNLGICSALSFTEKADTILVHNWAISCRYFEIGLEEFILLYLIKIAKQRALQFRFQDTSLNMKALEFINKYPGMLHAADSEELISCSTEPVLVRKLSTRTNLQQI